VPFPSFIPPLSPLYFHSTLFNSLFALFILLRFSFLGGWVCSVNKSPCHFTALWPVKMTSVYPAPAMYKGKSLKIKKQVKKKEYIRTEDESKGPTYTKCKAYVELCCSSSVWWYKARNDGILNVCSSGIQEMVATQDLEPSCLMSSVDCVCSVRNCTVIHITSLLCAEKANCLLRNSTQQLTTDC
jgi:hypothetical protein